MALENGGADSAWRSISGGLDAKTIAEKLGMTDVDLTGISNDNDRLNWAAHWRPILLAIGLASFNQLSGINAILYYLNDIFAAGGYSQLSSNLQAVAVGVANLLATFLGMFLIDRLGRRSLLLIGSVGTAIALAGVALIYSIPGYESYLLALLIIYIVFFAISQGAVIWVYLSEIFPTSVRSRGQALGSATHWIWAAVLSGSFKWVADSFDKALPFWFFSAMMVLQLVVVLKFFPETKGKSLEQIQGEMVR
jgi:MFS family permease